VEDIGAEIGQLVGPSLQRRLFVCMTEAAGPPEAEFPVLPEHLRHLMGWERDGVLFGSGPFMEDGRPGQRAMYILRAESREEAEALVAEEPLVKRGLRTSTMHEWSLNQGRVSVQLDFSSQRGGLDGVPAAR
jgi:uncharacterized protein YciI